MKASTGHSHLTRLSALVRKSLFALVLFNQVASSRMPRRTVHHEIASEYIGTKRSVQAHHFGPKNSLTRRAYIQASLHADELPGIQANFRVLIQHKLPVLTSHLFTSSIVGMLVAHHLIHLLDDAAEQGLIKDEIIIVPFANPIGLSQHVLGSQIGRFSLESGINFNRDYTDIGPAVAARVGDKLCLDGATNVKLIRDAMIEEMTNLKVIGEEGSMKRILFEMACTSDIVLDLHCDSDAVLHMYTHSKLWPNLSDLAAELGSEVHLLALQAGGLPFDDACSCPWSFLAERFPSFPIPMACESATIELRGESDVSPSIRTQSHFSFFFLSILYK